MATDEEAPVQIWVPPLDLVKFWNNQSPDFKVKLLFFQVGKMKYIIYFILLEALNAWGYSSVVEHFIADKRSPVQIWVLPVELENLELSNSWLQIKTVVI